MVFTLGVLLLGAVALAGVVAMLLGCMALGQWLVIAGVAPLLLYSLALFVHALTMFGSLHIALLSVASAFTQLMGYGFGFLQAWWRRCVKGKDEFSAFEKTFYK